MPKPLTMVCRKSETAGPGKLECPTIMTLWETLEELGENLKDACTLVVMEDVPEGFGIKEIALSLVLARQDLSLRPVTHAHAPFWRLLMH